MNYTDSQRIKKKVPLVTTQALLSDEEMALLYKKGSGLRTLAKLAGLHHYTVKARLIAQGVEIRRGVPRVCSLLPQEEVERALACPTYRKGAELLGVHWTTLKREENRRR